VSTARYIARAADAAARHIGDELMVMSGRDSSLFSLNETAAALWEAADGATPLEQIVELHICAEFEVDPATALADAEEVTRELASHGILIVSDVPIPGP
jgi:hypothetical protein